MKKALLVILVLSCHVGLVSAETTQSEVGMIFQLKNLLLSIDSFNDGYQTGIGLKWWPNEKIAIRGLLGFDLAVNAGLALLEAGTSAGVEYHPRTDELSPYFGGFAGFLVTRNVTTSLAFLFGGMFGAEVRVWKNVAFFAEYDLIATVDENGFSLATHAGGGAQLGLIIYFR